MASSAQHSRDCEHRSRSQAKAGYKAHAQQRSPTALEEKGTVRGRWLRLALVSSSSMVENLPSMQEALSSIPCTGKRKIKARLSTWYTVSAQ